jgi:hypothetical protein
VLDGLKRLGGFGLYSPVVEPHFKQGLIWLMLQNTSRSLPWLLVGGVAYG